MFLSISLAKTKLNICENSISLKKYIEQTIYSFESMDDFELSSSSFFIPGNGETITENQFSTPTRRRVRKTKDSAVVLDFQALRRCIAISPDQNIQNSANSDREEWAVQQIQKLWRQVWKKRREFSNNRYANVIQRWFRIQKSAKKHTRLLRFTQGNRWTARQSHLVFGLILSRRVRILLRCATCSNCINALKDTLRVLNDILHPSSVLIPNRASNVSRSQNLIMTLGVISKIMKNKGDARLLEQYGVSPSDRDLAINLLRQFQINKSRLHDLIFCSSRWRSLPHPGYLDISRSIKINVSLCKRKALTSNLPPRNASTDFPSSSSASRPIEHSASASMHTPPRSLRSVDTSLSPPCPPPKGPYRAGPRAHIQLDILGADNLCTTRRSNVSDVPNRKPCLRISLLLPAVPAKASGAGANELSIVRKISREFPIQTLHPRWDCTVHVPLPCPKGLYPSDDDLIAAKGRLLDKKSYAALLDWWAGGLIKVEVVDGDRFNPDFFLGEATIYLSQFLLQQAVGGTFPLSKQNVTDRVTGTITMHAFLHLPEVSTLINESSKMSSPIDAICDAVLDGEVVQVFSAQKIARSVRTSQSRFQKTPSPSTLRTISPVQTSGSVIGAEEGISLPLPPPPPSLESYEDAAGLSRRRQISACLDGLEIIQAGTDALLGQINDKLRAKHRSTPS